MLRVFDFECSECGGVEEHVVKGEEHPLCSLCSVPMRRLPAAPRLDYNSFWLAGMESGDRWTKWRKDRQKREEKALENHGTYSYSGQRSSWDKGSEITVNGERLKKVQ